MQNHTAVMSVEYLTWINAELRKQADLAQQSRQHRPFARRAAVGVWTGFSAVMLAVAAFLVP